MNSLMRSLISSAIIGITAFSPLSAPLSHFAYADDVAALPQRETRMIAMELSQMMATRYHRILKAMPQTMVSAVKLQRKELLNRTLNRGMSGLESGKVSEESAREQLYRQNQKEIQAQKRELFYELHAMDNDSLATLGEMLKRNANYQNLDIEFQSAFTKTEKANVLATAVFSDLDLIGSSRLKKARTMDKAALKNDMLQTQALLNTKGRDDDEWTDLLLISAGTIALTSLVSWGVANSVYGGRYDSRKSELENAFNSRKSQLEGIYGKRRNELESVYQTRRTQLENQYQNTMAELTNTEMNTLRESGFVFTTCLTYFQPDSKLCNRYNYAMFVGQTVCTVQCYKNTRTGQETLHQAPSCVSPFIPADCYDPNEYEIGKRNGYNDGYDDGYLIGDRDGYNDGGYDGANDGAYDGDNDGYNRGYDEGYYDGYNRYGRLMAASIQSVPSAAAVAGTGKLFHKGYLDGLSDAKITINLN